MNLDWLKSFIVLAHTENFSRSAEILRCSQPSVSRQIRLLEAHLKFQLFFRNQREVRLTEKGRDFLKKIEPIIDDLENLIEQPDLDLTGLSGHLRLGALQEIGQTFFMPMINEFLSTSNALDDLNFRLSMKYSTSLELLHAIKSAKIDFAVVKTDPDDSNIRCYPFVDEKIVLVTSSTNKKRVQDIQELQFVSHGENDPILKMMIKTYAPQVNPNKIVERITVNSLSSMILILRSTNLYGAIPLHAALEHIKSGALKLVGGFETKNSLFFIHYEKEFFSPLEQQFKKFILKKTK